MIVLTYDQAILYALVLFLFWPVWGLIVAFITMWRQDTDKIFRASAVFVAMVGVLVLALALYGAVRLIM